MCWLIYFVYAEEMYVIIYVYANEIYIAYVEDMCNVTLK